MRSEAKVPQHNNVWMSPSKVRMASSLHRILSFRQKARRQTQQHTTSKRPVRVLTYVVGHRLFFYVCSPLITTVESLCDEFRVCMYVCACACLGLLVVVAVEPKGVFAFDSDFAAEPAPAAHRTVRYNNSEEETRLFSGRIHTIVIPLP
ncbi:hypothetical protein EJ05DRAFT_198629 [Pseudovirgaria hyperparasitica]|uniref:Uncharacterized protein n=1 Tax=Pseudovirgaria hyperparasitica TaxID=470096 RepID=A0A6A6WH56_9PEZI|nr:uncharacterized protein EJ05DRAFT_198629 [Pseudovirgaria hyperparasitica]KAF2762138.1 hypothetical protein EJ05DRAFT_198629 [Pseudovirgaria hyperparasitica]